MPCKATHYVDNDSHHTAGNVGSPASQKDCFNEAGLESYCRSTVRKVCGVTEMLLPSASLSSLLILQEHEPTPGTCPGPELNPTLPLGPSPLPPLL